MFRLIISLQPSGSYDLQGIPLPPQISSPSHYQLFTLSSLPLTLSLHKSTVYLSEIPSAGTVW